METGGNTTLVSTVQDVAEGLGLLFYLVDPQKSSFSSIEYCPDYVSQVETQILTLKLLE